MTTIVFLGVNDIGERIYDWLVDRSETEVLALITEKTQLSIVKELQPEMLVSAGFRHIVPEEILQIPDMGAINLHKAYLPYNRGANPNVWSIIEDAPAGVSIYYMTGELDAGPIIDRRKVPVYPDDDGRDLYERLEQAQFEQFTEVWPTIRAGTVDPIEQDSESATYHLKEDFVDLWELDRSATVEIGPFLDRLRALTFQPYNNAYFEANDQRYWVEISITPEGEDQSDGDVPAEKNVPRYTTAEYEDDVVGYGLYVVTAAASLVAQLGGQSLAPADLIQMVV